MQQLRERMERDETIVLIGAGNMATQLAVALCRCGYKIEQIYSRTPESAQALQARLGGNMATTNRTEEIRKDASLYLFSISDNALQEVVGRIEQNEALWVHTAGSMPMDVFRGKTSHYGVLYPMQTTSKEILADWSEVPFSIEASTLADTERIERIARSLSNNVIRSNSEQRKALHLAAVFACNFTNHMYAIAERLLRQQGLDFGVMKLLIRETERKAEKISPVSAQTGPAVRNDHNVMDEHIDLLQASPEAALYKLISENIGRYSQQDTANNEQ